jgi:hypothetical protein
MSNIDHIIQSIQALHAADRAALLTKLQDVSASESKASLEKHRLSALRAAANDPARAVAFKSALKGLARLDLTVERLAASASGLAELNKAMDEAGWQMYERVQLKTSLAGIGLID